MPLVAGWGNDGNAAQVRDPWRIVDNLGLDHDPTLTASVGRGRPPKELDADQSLWPT